ncbi:MAG: nucleotidyltransferase family protein [Lachnospiraceae bacterium]|nr:nucleotidyltransferase family protein [Lachnospiraceae bacterium]
MEANPLHKGHIALMRHAREELGADRLIIVLSGDHVQRGEPALTDRHVRTRMLLAAGADLVLQLPIPFACGSAEYFARGAVSILEHTGACDLLLFGSESGEINVLRKLAPSGSFLPFSERPAPNDILGAAYLEALEHLRSPLRPVTMRRLGVAHDSSEASGGYASAGLLRKYLLASDERAYAYMPEENKTLIGEYLRQSRFLCLDDYSDLLYYALRSEADQGFADYFDVCEDLSDRFRSRLERFENASAFVEACKSKEISAAHIRRSLLHILLKIRREHVATLIEECAYCPYLLPLGFRRDAGDLLHAIRANADRPILSKAADAHSLLSDECFAVFDLEMRASELRTHIARKEGGTLSEYRRSPVIL